MGFALMGFDNCVKASDDVFNNGWEGMLLLKYIHRGESYKDDWLVLTLVCGSAHSALKGSIRDRNFSLNRDLILTASQQPRVYQGNPVLY